MTEWQEGKISISLKLISENFKQILYEILNIAPELKSKLALINVNRKKINKTYQWNGLPCIKIVRQSNSWLLTK